MMSYYMQLKDLVLPGLKYFQSDLLNLDRKSLFKYSGTFLYSCRDSGTDLYKLDYSINYIDENVYLKFDAAYTFLLRPGNNNFYYGHAGVVKKVSRSFIEKQFLNFAKHLATLKSHYVFNNLVDEFKRENLYKSEFKKYQEIMK